MSSFTCNNRATRSFLRLFVILGLVLLNNLATGLAEVADGNEGVRDLVSGGGIDPNTYCAPEYTTKIKPCARRIKYCTPLGAPMKFTGRGCRISGVALGDGGCQCDGYCGYACPRACNKDSQCTWNLTANACYSKATGLEGVPILSCLSGSSAPSTAPVLSSSSAPSATPSTHPTGGCFAKDAVAELKNGERIALHELKYGDEVLAFDPETEAPIYSPVIAFTRFSPDWFAENGFKITLAETNDAPLVLSYNHLVFASLDGFSAPDFHHAQHLTTNSILYVQSAGSKTKVPRQVLTIQIVANQGWVTPLTQSGTIVVNGIWSSCHTTHHTLARIFYAPLNWYLQYVPREKGSSPNDTWYNEMWFSVTFRRSPFGKYLQDIMQSIYSIATHVDGVDLPHFSKFPFTYSSMLN